MKKMLMHVLFFQSMFADHTVSNLQRYMLANYYQFGNDLKNAEYWYSQLVPDLNSIYVYLGYIPFLASHELYTDIVKLIPQLDSQFKSNVEIQLVFATALEKTNQKQEAHTRLAALNEQNKSNQELAFKVVQMYLERAEPENAIKVIDNLLNSSARKPNNYIFYFIKSQIYAQLNKKTQALETIKQCIDLYPKFDKSWLLYAILQEQENKLEDAIKGYSTYLETSSDSKTDIERHLIDLTLKQKILSQKNNMQDKNLINQTLSYIEDKDLTNAAVALSTHLGYYPNDIQARLLKIQLLILKKDFDSAVNLLSQWITSETETELWLKTLHLLCYIGLDYNKALQALESLEKNSKTPAKVFLYKADIALRANQQKTALEALLKAQNGVKDIQTKNQIALQIAIIYYDQKKWKLVQKTLEDSFDAKEIFPPSNNLLAYLYVSKFNNVNRASELITDALKKDPENPHFLDTQAYILYKQKDYDRAISLLQKAARTCPTDFTILTHLGKCHFHKGNTKLAMQSMRAAAKIAKTKHEKIKATNLITAWSK